MIPVLNKTTNVHADDFQVKPNNVHQAHSAIAKPLISGKAFQKPSSQLLKVCFAGSISGKSQAVVAKDFFGELERKNGNVFRGILDKFNQSQVSDLHREDFWGVCAKLNEKHPELGLSSGSEHLWPLADATAHCLNGNKGALLANVGGLKDILTRPYGNYWDKVNDIATCATRFAKETIKFENLFGEFDQSGNIENGQGKNGIFTDDTQFVSHYKLAVENNSLETESTQALSGALRKIVLQGNDGLKIVRERAINKGLFEQLTLDNPSAQDKTLRLDLGSQVKDLWEVSWGGTPDRECEPPAVQPDGSIIFNTQIDNDLKLGIRALIKIDGKPVNCHEACKLEISQGRKFSQNGGSLSAAIKIPANSQNNKVEVHLQPIISDRTEATVNKPYVNGRAVDEATLPVSYNDAICKLKSNTGNSSQIKMSGTGVFAKEADEVMAQAFEDIHALETKLTLAGQEYTYPAAGLPDYANLFGRDSIHTALSVLPVNPGLAKGTMELLGELQGKAVEGDSPAANFRRLNKEDEGCILGVRRVGKVQAAHQATPYQASYGWSMDPTPLWLNLVAEYHKWTGDDETVRKLQPKIDKALKWIDKNSNQDGFLQYHVEKSRNGDDTQGDDNRGWKDSFETIVPPPTKGSSIALAEVQGYVYSAKKGIADLYKKLGLDGADKLDQQAETLKKNFNAKFWGGYSNRMAMVLVNGQPHHAANGIPGSSNVIQSLSSGIISEEKFPNGQSPADYTRELAMSPVMYAKNVGIRTLSKDTSYYAPVKGYHWGTVWPHDNAICARGLFHEDAAKIAKDQITSVATLPNKQAPEVLAALDREDDENVNVYPHTCNPQAWSCASIISDVITPLGIMPDVKNKSVILDNPVLPEELNDLEIKGLHINGQIFDMSFSKTTKSGSEEPINNLTLKLPEKTDDICQGVIKNSKGEIIKVQLSTHTD